MTANFATEKFKFTGGFFTLPVKKTKPLSEPYLQEEPANCAPPSVCSAAVAAAGMKSERFQNSSSNKSRREGAGGDTAAARLLPGYNMLRDDSVTQAGQLWTVWSVLRDSSANCEALLRRVRCFFRLNQAWYPLLWLPRPVPASLFALHLICPHLRWKMGSSFSP